MAGWLSLCLVSVGCASGPDLDHSLNSIVKPYRFSILKWELNTLLGTSSYDKEAGEEVVSQYFALVGEIKSLELEIEAVRASTGEGSLSLLEAKLCKLREQRLALAVTVEVILRGQIKGVLAGEGIFNPLDKYMELKVNLPPVSFKLETPPHLLVISPRDRIESLREILLRQEMSLEQMEQIEAKADKLGVSSLVVELGGLAATYPSFVAAENSLRHTIDTAIEEWLHQYLAFTPLGFLYLLDQTGLSRNYEIATINETVASMVGKEIGATLCEQYYPGCEDSEKPEAASGFDFNREMREIRKAVDEYIAQGEIMRAEEFMEQKRQYLASKGYYIRKLNQAYFAFHGTYADKPTSISPIGPELKDLRNRSASVKDFLDKVSGMTSRQRLGEAIK